MGGKEVVDRIVDVIVNPVILLIFAAGFVLFLWGLVVFMWQSESPEERQTGTRHMIWGIAGMFIMVSFYAIIQLILNTFGIRLS